jgi:hypothetical protein
LTSWGKHLPNPDISRDYWQKAVLHGITEFPFNS